MSTSLPFPSAFWYGQIGGKHNGDNFRKPNIYQRKFSKKIF